MTPISKELEQLIEKEAEIYAEDVRRNQYKIANESFKNGATAYAHYKESCEELERWKRETMELLAPLLDYGQSKEANIPWGASIAAVILQRAKQFEQAKKVLDRLKSVVDSYSHTDSLNPPMKHLQAIINEVLASWKEEGKEIIRCSGTGKPIEDFDCGSEHK